MITVVVVNTHHTILIFSKGGTANLPTSSGINLPTHVVIYWTEDIFLHCNPISTSRIGSWKVFGHLPFSSFNTFCHTLCTQYLSIENLHPTGFRLLLNLHFLLPSTNEPWPTWVQNRHLFTKYLYKINKLTLRSCLPDKPFISDIDHLLLVTCPSISKCHQNIEALTVL